MRVTKTEIIAGVSGLVIAVIVIGGGLWWHGHKQQPKQLSEASSKTTSNPNISLGQDNSGGLSVSGQASDLGQLGNNSSAGQAQTGQGQNESAGSGSSGGLNPSTFTQYDKYKNSKDALFGDMQVGNGAKLSTGQKASIYYKAWLTNGALVDQSPVSSSGQPQPYSFTLGAHKVIPGLEEGTYGMKVGGKRLIIVPPAVGYGSAGQGSVPPNAVMVFEVQLVSVQ